MSFACLITRTIWFYIYLVKNNEKNTAMVPFPREELFDKIKLQAFRQEKIFVTNILELAFLLVLESHHFLEKIL